MSNAGKRVLNWRRDYPVLRTALGLLGAEGWRSMQAAHFLVWHEKLADLREEYKILTGRDLNAEVLHSRLRRPHELDWIKENVAWAYQDGRKLKRVLAASLSAARIAKS